MSKNYYNSHELASASNWELLVELFGKKKTVELIKPSRYNSVFDGMLKIANTYILVEVKRRQFDNLTLTSKYGGKFFLEEAKYKYLHNRAKKINEDTGRKMTIWYLTKTSDGVIYIFDIYNKEYKWQEARMNYNTYGNKSKVEKAVTLLDINDCIFKMKTNIKY